MDAEQDGNSCCWPDLHCVLHSKMSGKEEKKSVHIFTDLAYGIFLFILKVNHSLI